MTVSAGMELLFDCCHLLSITSFVPAIIVSDGSCGVGSSWSHHSVSYCFAAVLNIFIVLRTGK